MLLFSVQIHCFIWDNSVGIALGWTSWAQFWAEAKIILFPVMSALVLGPTQPPVQ
jgi:hypothetical protein